MNDEQKLEDVMLALADSRIAAGLSPSRREALWREAADLAAAVARTPLPADAEPSSYQGVLLRHASEQSR